MLRRLEFWARTIVPWAKRYGIKKGIKVVLQCELADRNRQQFALVLPDHQAPIWLRGGTTDPIVYCQVLLQEEYDISSTPQGKEIRRRYEASIASGVEPLIIDCGANIGLASIWFAKTFPKARIIAVEPDESNVELAKKNIATYSNIELVRGAVWDASNSLDIVNPTAGKWAYRVEEATQGSTPAFTIDQISKGRPILIVKIDIEGSEKALFRSNTEWIDRTDLIAIELHDRIFPNEGTSQTFVKAIAGRCHEITTNGENLFLLLQQGA
jgi:FkbM family methyltransferase